MNTVYIYNLNMCLSVQSFPVLHLTRSEEQLTWKRTEGLAVSESLDICIRRRSLSFRNSDTSVGNELRVRGFLSSPLSSARVVFRMLSR